MRTLDPETWAKSLRKPRLQLSRPLRFGQRARPAAGRAPPRARRSFHRAMRDYLTNCSVVGVRCITSGTKPMVRSCYGVVVLLLLCFGLYTVIESGYRSSTTEPSTVGLRAGLHTIEHVPFPAVAFCSNNVVSRRALHHYTNTLVRSQHRNKTYSAAEIAQKLAQLGHLLAVTMPPEHVDINFMGYLASIDPRARVSRLMYMFAPECSSMLLRCSWRGEMRPCEELLQTRITPLGYCCVFNSRYQPQDVFKLPKFLDAVGKDFGLSVVIQQDITDFDFFRRPSLDIDVLLFDGDDYPLLEGGGARLHPVEGNASVYLALTASVHYSEEGFHHDIESVRCQSRRARRSRAWCLAECRRRTLAALCACRLHTLPDLADAETHTHLEECSLTHLACLNHHQEKFMYYNPGGAVPLEQELRSAQDCTHCVPDCARAAYAARVAVTGRAGRDLLTDPLLEGLPLLNATTTSTISVIRLFFASKEVNSYEFQANSGWYESFVQYGSKWALIVGTSVVAALELVFHCVLRWHHHYCRRSPPANQVNF